MEKLTALDKEITMMTRNWFYELEEGPRPEILDGPQYDALDIGAAYDDYIEWLSQKERSSDV